MDKGQFCFLSDQYYVDFPDKFLMRGRDVIDGVSHRRPCFFVFHDSENQEISWLVPISSKYAKYKAIHDKKVEKYGNCNTIRFGVVLGTQAAFLIQNMCPVTSKYITGIYVDKNNTPIQIDNRTVQDVISNAREVLAMTKRGAILIFPDVRKIRTELLRQLDQG
jgi:hypothetical protein